MAFQDIHDSNFTLFIGKSYDYNELLEQLRLLEEHFALIPEDNTEKRLATSAKIGEQKDKIKGFKRDVLNLAETFSKLEINTERLKRAKEFFDKGEFGEARAGLADELENMQGEQSHLLSQKDRYEKEVLPKLVNNSEEFLILALTTQTDYSNPNRFEESCKYFRSSIQSSANKSNIFNFAYFLQEHNQFLNAEKYYSRYLKDFSTDLSEGERATTLNNLALLHNNQADYEKSATEYEEALKIRRRLVDANPTLHLPDLAMLLNNLANLDKNQNNFKKASQGYQEALKIYRILATDNSDIYMSGVAMTQNNLGILHTDQNRYAEALVEFEEALKIYRRLAEIKPNLYLPGVASTLHNLANLYKAENSHEKGLKEYEEALEIRRKLANGNPNIYLPAVAMTLNGLAGLHWENGVLDKTSVLIKEALKIYRQLGETHPRVYLPDIAMALNNLAILNRYENNYTEALRRYKEALDIRRELAEANPNVHLPDLAATLINLSVFHQVSVPEREKSIAFATEALEILTPLVEKIPYLQRHIDVTIAILQDWG